MNYINFSYCPRLVRHQGVAWDGPEVKIQENVIRLLSLLSVPLVWGVARALAGPAPLPVVRAALLCPQHSRLGLQSVIESTFSVIRLTIRLLSEALRSAFHCSKKGSCWQLELSQGCLPLWTLIGIDFHCFATHQNLFFWDEPALPSYLDIIRLL